MAEWTITDHAAEVLRRGFETASLDPQSAGVRIRIAGGSVRTMFADEPSDGDQVIETHGLRIFLDAGLAARATVAIGVSAEHEQIVIDGAL